MENWILPSICRNIGTAYGQPPEYPVDWLEVGIWNLALSIAAEILKLQTREDIRRGGKKKAVEFLVDPSMGKILKSRRK